MKYTSCDNTAFFKTSTYCAYDATCYRLVKDNALWKRFTDSRDGTVCQRYVSACPC